jgi:hypothetical protein
VIRTPPGVFWNGQRVLNSKPKPNNNQPSHQEVTYEIKRPKNGKTYKTYIHRIQSYRRLYLLMLALGCTSQQTQNKEKLLTAAGFKVIVPRTAAQQQKLQALPADKVTLVRRNGKTYYVFPDAANNQAYVGGPKQYQAYRQLLLANKLANENLEAAEMNEDPSLNWDEWGGIAGPEWTGLFCAGGRQELRRASVR